MDSDDEFEETLKTTKYKMKSPERAVVRKEKIDVGTIDAPVKMTRKRLNLKVPEREPTNPDSDSEDLSERLEQHSLFGRTPQEFEPDSPRNKPTSFRKIAKPTRAAKPTKTMTDFFKVAPKEAPKEALKPVQAPREAPQEEPKSAVKQAPKRKFRSEYSSDSESEANNAFDNDDDDEEEEEMDRVAKLQAEFARKQISERLEREKMATRGRRGRGAGVGVGAGAGARAETEKDTKEVVTRRKRGEANSKKFICDICEKVFKANDKLREHVHSHTDEAQAECPLCHCLIKFKANLKVHLTKCQEDMRGRKCEEELAIYYPEYAALLEEASLDPTLPLPDLPEGLEMLPNGLVVGYGPKLSLSMVSMDGKFKERKLKKRNKKEGFPAGSKNENENEDDDIDDDEDSEDDEDESLPSTRASSIRPRGRGGARGGRGVGRGRGRAARRGGRPTAPPAAITDSDESGSDEID